MNFSDLDQGEIAAGKSVEDLNPKELFEYAYFMFEDTFGYKLPTDYIKNLAVIKWFRKTYPRDAGRLIKWMFYKHEGTYRGEVFGINWFQSGHKWWIDQRLHEMKTELGEVKVIKRATKYGFVGLKEMREYAATAPKQEIPK
jgi:hypothetical protein